MSTCNFEYLKNKNIKYHLSPFCIKYFSCYFGTTGPSNIAKGSRSTNTAQGSFHFGPKLCNSDECHGLSVLGKFWLRDSTAHFPCFLASSAILYDYEAWAVLDMTPRGLLNGYGRKHRLYPIPWRQGDMFLRNICKHLQNYAVSESRRLQS
jgi:hypothetical protein